ncbi:MAG TPA: hypothetical protein DF383_06890 [Deltaproteobacteria bacterium]|nr:hypothetical protein [Deltaproteobacteria bacterium]
MAEPSDASENPAETPSLEPKTGDPDLEGLWNRLAETWEYGRFFLEARIARAKLGIRDTIKMAVLGVLLALVGGTALLIAVVFLFYGAAQGLKEWTGRPWAAYLISGGTPLLLIFAGFFLKWKSIERKSLAESLKNYESRLQKQRSTFGHDAAERAAAANRT